MNEGRCRWSLRAAARAGTAGVRRCLASGALLLPAIVLLAGLAASVAIHVRMVRDAEAVERREFEAATERIAAELSRSLRRFEFVLNGARGLFHASAGVTATQWAAYVGALEPSRVTPGIVAVGYAPRVATSDFSPGTGPAETAAGVPSDPVRFPVVFHALDEAGRGPQVGEDLLADPVRREAVLRTGAYTGAVASRTLALRRAEHDPAPRAGIMMLAAVDEQRPPRSAPTRGLVYVVLDVEQLVASMSSEVDAAPVSFNLLEDDGKRGMPVYASNAALDRVPIEAPHVRRRLLHVGGTPWVLEFYATPGHPAWAAGREAWFALATGAVLSALFALSLCVLMRKQRRIALRAAQVEREHALDRAQFEGLVASAMDAIVSLDAQLRIVLFNAAAEQMFGRSRAQMLGRPLDVLLPERARAAHERHLRRFLSAGETIRSMGEPGRVYGLRADGTEFPIEGSISSTGAAGTALLTVIMRDVSERQRAEADLRRHRDHLQELVAERTREYLRAKEEAESSNRAKSQFLANMSHELRTPMHAILSFSDLGRKRIGSAAPEKIAGYFESIWNSGKRLTLLIDDLLDLAKLEAGRTVLDLQPARLQRIVAEALAEIAPLLNERSLQLEIANGEGDAALEADPLKLGQVVRNLLSNAVKFSPPGGVIRVEIEAAVLPAAARGCAEARSALRLSVADRGPGIPEAELDVVFDKFVQSSKTRSGAGGTGLGLAICREIVQLHGGQVEARNRPGGGARFSFTLPRARGERSAADRESVAREAA